MKINRKLGLLITFTFTFLFGLYSWGMEEQEKEPANIDLSAQSNDFLHMFGSHLLPITEKLPWELAGRILQYLQANTKNRHLGWPVIAEPMAASFIAFSPDGQLVVVNTDKGELVVLDTKSNTTIAAIEGQGKIASKDTYIQNKRLLWRSGHQASMWDLEKGTKIFSINNQGGLIDLSPNGQFILERDSEWAFETTIYDCEDIMRFPDRPHGFSTRSSKVRHQIGNQKVINIDVSGQQVVLSAGPGAELKDIEAETVIATFPHNSFDRSCTSLASFSPDEKLLAIASAHAVKVWNIESQEEIATWQVTDVISSVVFFGEGKLLVRSSSGNRQESETTTFAYYDLKESYTGFPVRSKKAVVSKNKVMQYAVPPTTVKGRQLDVAKYTYLTELVGCYEAENYQRFRKKTFIAYLVEKRPKELYWADAQEMEQAAFNMFAGDEDELNYVCAFFLDDRLPTKPVFKIFEN